MAPLFKVLNALARNYKMNLIKNQLVESVFGPLLKENNLMYAKLPTGDVTMYLELLSTLSTLSDAKIFDTKPDIFQKENVHFLVAMSIKHGSVAQCSLALSLVNRFAHTKIAEIIASKDNDFELISPQICKIPTIVHSTAIANGHDLSSTMGFNNSNERVKNVFFNIEKSYIEGKVLYKSMDGTHFVSFCFFNF